MVEWWVLPVRAMGYGYGLIWAICHGCGGRQMRIRMRRVRWLMRIFINRLVEQSGSLFDVCSAGCFGSPPRTSKEPLCGHRLRIVLCILHMISYNMYSIHNAKMYIFSSRDRRRLCVYIYMYIYFVGVCGYAMHVGMGMWLNFSGAWWTCHVTEKMTWRIVKRRPSWWKWWMDQECSGNSVSQGAFRTVMSVRFFKGARCFLQRAHGEDWNVESLDRVDSVLTPKKCHALDSFLKGP